MQQLTHYRDITAEIYAYLEKRIALLHRAGVKQVILDPGFGFAKTLDQNYELLAHLHTLTDLGCPILAGISRKSMIYKALDTDPADALTGTIALHWECLRQGASILRVHDTREIAQKFVTSPRCGNRPTARLSPQRTPHSFMRLDIGPHAFSAGRTVTEAVTSYRK